MIPPFMPNINLNSKPETVTGMSQEIMMEPRTKPLSGNFSLKSSAIRKPMINWKKIEPTVNTSVLTIAPAIC